MKRILTIAALLALLAVPTLAQSQETPLLRIGDNTFSLEEFEAGYAKNSKASLVPVSKREYLNLFLRYKLKVIEAKAMGLDTLDGYRTESAYYLSEMAKPFLTDTAAEAAARQKIADRLKEEINTSLLSVMLRPNVLPADTLAAYQQIHALKAKLDAGADFNQLVATESNDREARADSGKLGYISALYMTEMIEDVIYATPMGKHSDVFRSRVGYHIVKVHDRRPSGGEIRVAHIIKNGQSSQPNAPATDPKQAIDSIYARLLAGDDFATLARQCSDDEQSAAVGGEMHWFTRQSILSEFADHAFTLQNIGDVSKPFNTPFGWHIVKLLERHAELPSEKTDRMIAEASKSGHSVARAGRKAKAQQLLSKYDFRWNAPACDTLVSILNSTGKDSTKLRRIAALREPVAEYNGGKFFVNNMKLRTLGWDRRIPVSQNLDYLAEEEILRYETSTLESHNAAFRYMMQEYYDGLLIFEINQRMIWNPSLIDSAQVSQQYLANPLRYAQGGSFEGSIAFFDSPLPPEVVAAPISAKKNDLLKQATHIEKGKWQRGSIYDEYIWPLVPQRYVLLVGKVDNGQVQPLDKVRSRVVADCQQRLENTWLENLYNKYKPQILSNIE